MACNQSAIDNYTLYLNDFQVSQATYNTSPTSANATALQSAANQFISNANSMISSCQGTLSSSQLSSVQSSVNTVQQVLSQISNYQQVLNFYNNSFMPAWKNATADYTAGNYTGAIAILQTLLNLVNNNQTLLGSYYSQFQKIIQQSINNLQGSSQSIINTIDALWNDASNYYGVGQYSNAVNILQKLLNIIVNNQSALGSYYQQYYNAVSQSISNLQGSLQSISSTINALWNEASKDYSEGYYLNTINILQQLLNIIVSNQSALGSYYQQYYNVVSQSLANLSKYDIKAYKSV